MARSRLKTASCGGDRCAVPELRLGVQGEVVLGRAGCGVGRDAGAERLVRPLAQQRVAQQRVDGVLGVVERLDRVEGLRLPVGRPDHVARGGGRLGGEHRVVRRGRGCSWRGAWPRRRSQPGCRRAHRRREPSSCVLGSGTWSGSFFRWVWARSSVRGQRVGRHDGVVPQPELALGRRAHVEGGDVVVRTSDHLDAGGDSVGRQARRHRQHRVAAGDVEHGSERGEDVEVQMTSGDVDAVGVLLTGAEPEASERRADERVVLLEDAGEGEVDLGLQLQAVVDAGAPRPPRWTWRGTAACTP